MTITHNTSHTETIVGIISDSHDHLEYIDKALKLFRSKQCELVIHAGDFVSPFALARFRNLWCPLAAIYGNNEGEKAGLSRIFGERKMVHEPPLEYAFKQYRFFITHIPFDFTALASSGIYDAIIYGHTHRSEISHHGETVIINPGECCGWLEGKPTVATLTLPEKKVNLFNLTETSE